MSRSARRRQEKPRPPAGPSGRALELKRLLDEAVFHHRAGHFAEAEPLYRRVLQAEPTHAPALHMLGLLAYQTGKLEQAVRLISQAIRQDAEQAPYHFNLGVVFSRQGNLALAADAYRRALRLRPDYVEAHCNLGNLLREQGKLEPAVEAYRKALSVKADYADAHNNLGVALEELGRYEEAILSYERALGLNPRHAEAHANLGNTLTELGRFAEAEASFGRALDLKPDYAKGHYNLAFAYLWQGRLDEAHAAFMRSARLKQDHGRPVSGEHVYQSRLRHEVEQVRYLRDRGLLPQEQAGYLAALERAETAAACETQAAGRIAIGADALREIAPSFNRLLHHAVAETLPQGALNPALDAAAIEARYNASRPEIMHVDHLLNAEALAGLRRFCLESTIWKKNYENGYLGAFLGDGFSSPLLLRISEELRLRFPGIFKEHRLRQAWAFKYDSRLRGLNIHADAAAVNVNFWITPDEANLDPDHGGLVVWDKEAPREWNFREYNSTAMEPRIREFLRASGAKAVTVPYRQNRAVIFNSDLFHETDRISFKEGYENRRVNITLLYGKRFG
jgi:tetratricopeptide (TPR) repeat protein